MCRHFTWQVAVVLLLLECLLVTRYRPVGQWSCVLYRRLIFTDRECRLFSLFREIDVVCHALFRENMQEGLTGVLLIGILICYGAVEDYHAPHFRDARWITCFRYARLLCNENVSYLCMRYRIS